MSLTKAGMQAAMTVVNHGVNDLIRQLPGFIQGSAHQHLDSPAGQQTLYQLVYEGIDAYLAVNSKQVPATTSTAGDVHAAALAAMQAGGVAAVIK